MSIHANLTPEAQMRLRAQQRNSKLSSAIIAILSAVVIALLLALKYLPGILPPAPEIEVTSVRGIIDEPHVTPVPVTPQLRKPTPPAAGFASLKSLAANSLSQVSIPAPDIQVDAPNVVFGGSDDFGGLWGNDANPGEAGGGGSMFGSSTSISGALKGKLYDFKQDRKGEMIAYNPSAGNYAGILKSAERRDFSPSSFSDYFAAPNELFLTNLAIPFSSASLGPEYFGAKGTIKPSGWVAVYTGLITAPATGKYRLRGASDDFMVVLVEGRRNLVACWPDLQTVVAGNWEGGEIKGSRKSPLGGAQLHAGDWLDLRAGEAVEITVAVGERPGGSVGFVLEIEEKGRNYRKDPNGRTILPLFTTRPFSAEERAEIERRFGSYLFEWEDVPVFGGR